MDQAGAARAQPGDVLDQVVRGGALEDRGGGQVEWDGVGDPGDLGRRHAGVLGVAAPGDAPGDAVAGRQVRDAGADRDDLAGAFHAEGAGQADGIGGGGRILALAGVHVHEVDAGVGDPRHHVAGRGIGHGMVRAHLQDFGAAVAFYQDGFHCEGFLVEGGTARRGIDRWRPS